MYKEKNRKKYLSCYFWATLYIYACFLSLEWLVERMRSGIRPPSSNKDSSVEDPPLIEDNKNHTKLSAIIYITENEQN